METNPTITACDIFSAGHSIMPTLSFFNISLVQLMSKQKKKNLTSFDIVRPTSCTSFLAHKEIK